MKSSTPIKSSQDRAVAAMIAYHDQTKHQPGRYARGPGGLDWANQPNPFRLFTGAPVVTLPRAVNDDTPPATVLFGATGRRPTPLTLDTLGLFFELSLGLSAKKELPGASWFLRVNPSSGNLHPTEAYAILPALDGLSGGPGVYHYAPLQHALEQRAQWVKDSPRHPSGFCVGLTSIVWREAWKYGERAFRYCQHDVGHALGALRFAAAALGWRLQVLAECPDPNLAGLLGLDRAEDFKDAEREIPQLLATVDVSESATHRPLPPVDAFHGWCGNANRLSRIHVEWPAIGDARVASERRPLGKIPPELSSAGAWPAPSPPVCGRPAAQLIRQRRSAVAFDGVTSLSRDTMLAMLDTTLPRPGAPPFDAWPFAPRLHLVLFVHRVTGLEPGLYAWLRAPEAIQPLRSAMAGEFGWERPPGVARAVPLYRLTKGDLQAFARTVSCGQDIAADSAFSLGMLARFEPVLRERGAAAYRELFWEAGMIGQALYLAAEAAGARGTGIGCYLDDLMHRALGLSGHDWQSIYHFTVGSPIEDPRLRTLPPYAHLAR